MVATDMSREREIGGGEIGCRSGLPPRYPTEAVSREPVSAT